MLHFMRVELHILFNYIANPPECSYHKNMLFKYNSDGLMLKHMVQRLPFEKESYFFSHNHKDTFEIIYMIQGIATLYVADNLFNLKPSNLVIVPPGVAHWVSANNRYQYERFVGNIPINSLPIELQEKASHLNYVYSIANDKYFESILNHIEKIYSLYSGDIQKKLLEDTLIEILAYFSYSEETMKEEHVVSERMTKILDYIGNNFLELDSMHQLEHDLSLSKTTICKEFSDNLHVSPMAYIRIKKCMYAKSLIENGSRPIDIYEECGFKDYSTFYRGYMKTFGASPSQETERKY